MTKYSMSFKHEAYSTIIVIDSWAEVIELLEKVSYIDVGMSIEIESHEEARA